MWTLVSVSISYDGSHYITNALIEVIIAKIFINFLPVYVFNFIFWAERSFLISFLSYFFVWFFV